MNMNAQVTLMTQALLRRKSGLWKQRKIEKDVIVSDATVNREKRRLAVLRLAITGYGTLLTETKFVMQLRIGIHMY